jgi:hypothetical protein
MRTDGCCHRSTLLPAIIVWATIVASAPLNPGLIPDTIWGSPPIHHQQPDFPTEVGLLSYDNAQTSSKEAVMTKVDLTHRLALHDDLDALRSLMDAAISELQKAFLNESQISSSRAITRHSVWGRPDSGAQRRLA